jgi:hypothetical protein
MFRALLGHPQEALPKRTLVFAGVCQLTVVWLQFHCNIPNAVCVVPPEDEQVMLETFRGLDSQ